MLNTGLGSLKLFKWDINRLICPIPVDKFVDEVIDIAGYDFN